MIEALRQFDISLFHFVNQTIANSFLDVLCPILRDKRFLILCYIVFAARVYQLYPRQFFKIATAGALTFLLTDQISSSIIKPIFHRLRPCNDSAVGARLIIQYCGAGFSFVSSHAANSFGMAAFLSAIFVNKRKEVLILAIWASLVSFSQVYVGIHYPGDVIAGGILGVIIGASIGILFRKIISTTEIKP